MADNEQRARTEKRARKKAARDAELERRMAAYRRRRNARLATVLIALGVIIVLALVMNGDEKKEKPQDEPTAASEEAACGAEAPPAADPKQYDEPEQVLEDGVDYSAVIHTSCGDIEMDLFEDQAPITVNNFVFLAGEGYFDGQIWHRVEQSFVIQSGDPNGFNGQDPDGPGYTIEDELPERDREYTFGVLAMANTGQPNSGGSQFFIIVHDREGAEAGDPEPAGLDATYSIFGMVDESSWDVLEEIAAQPIQGGGDPTEASKPVVPIYIESIEILTN